jgi:hypothetical protein
MVRGILGGTIDGRGTTVGIGGGIQAGDVGKDRTGANTGEANAEVLGT